MVKLAATLFIATALASSALAQDFSGSSSAEDFSSRELSDQVFARAAAKVVQDLYTREDLSSLVGRELADGELISAREIEDLMEREIEWDGEEFAARQDGSDGAEGAGEGEGEGASPPPSPSPKGVATPKAAPPAGPQQQGVFSRLMGVFGNLLNPKPNAAKKGSPAPPKGKGPAAPAAPAKEGAEPTEANEMREMTTMLEEPLERSFAEEDLLEAEAREAEDLMEREPEPEFDEELLEREPEPEFDEELMEREPEPEFDEELMEREPEPEFGADEELLERELFEGEELMEREPEPEFEEMVEREFEGMDELD